MLDVNFNTVERNYPGAEVIAILAFFTDCWHVNAEDVTAKGSIIDQILFLHTQGATTLELRAKLTNGEYADMDIYMYELLNS